MREQSYLTILRTKDDAPLSEAICTVMNAAIESLEPCEGRATGCLITNLARELATLDPDLALKTSDQLANMQSALHVRVKRAQEVGDLDKRHQPEALSAYLMTVLQGLLVISTTTRDIEGMRHTRDLALERLS
jgi:TetR/AcrR family transcriptional regulator, transcriptional repressor for nem operon